ncbi:MAG: UvrD-helicase domain-containing protein [Flavobacteriales bacterium]|nr:UvrD-helicase domain-containing protein [Flavobacteriales bacterium]MCB9166123.1 UvrD-helicase domain-containing protein [Flavobacteriales bacterium]
MLNILHSSAGAGKTHALVKRYILLALGTERTQAYRQVLALTFTNKAAEEMRERVLTYLDELASGKHAHSRIQDLLGALESVHGVTAEQAQARAGAVHIHMLHHWSDVAITTIDAFIRRVVRPFARDLRLDQDLRMSTDQDHYHAEAVRRLLELAGDGPALTDLLLAACEQLVEDEQGWSPAPPFLELCTQLEDERAIAHLETLRQLGAGTFLRVRERLAREVRTFKDELRALGREAIDLLDGAGIHQKDLAQGGRGPYALFMKLAHLKDDVPPINRYVEKVQESGEWCSGSASPDACAAIRALVPRLTELMHRIRATYGGPLRSHHLRSALLGDLMPTGALHELDRQLQEVKEEDHIVFFQDLTRRVAALVTDEPAPFIYERLGQRYRHFLIDEFQDTSVLQWRSLLPLIENALGEGGEVLLVGDAKQAIYRWRNGEVRQFIELPDLHDKERIARGAELAAALKAADRPIPPLIRNHRSGKAIIAFNNRLFTDLRTTLPERYRKVFDDVAQEPCAAGEGMIFCTLVPTDLKGHDRDVFEQQRILDIVREALEDGYAPGDIAVLTRSGAQGRIAAQTLTAAGWSVVSPDGLKLANDHAVMAVVGTLRHLHDGSEETAARALQSWALTRGQGDTGDAVLRPEARPALPSERLRALLGDGPHNSPGATLLDHVLAIILALDLDPATDMFLTALLDMAEECMTEYGHDPGAFLDQWDRDDGARGVNIPESRRAIRVMTIHRSKGLQFPVVIVPFSDMHVRGGSRQERLWVAPGEVVPELPYALVRANKHAELAHLPELQEEEDLRHLDAIDLLYVAFTRPEVRLYILLRETSKDPLVQGTIRQWKEHVALNGADVPIGARDQRTGKEQGAWNRSGIDLALTVQGPRRTIIRRTAPDAWDPADPAPLVRHGQLVHALLARVRTIDDLDPALRSEHSRGKLDQGTMDELLVSLRALLGRDDVHPFFAVGVEVFNESTLIAANGNAMRPDRIVHDGGNWRILDIKTGSPRASHIEQVKAYRELLSGIVHAPVHGALLYVRSGELIDA